MWERTLQDLIRGLRANKQDEHKFIAQAVDEIRKEIKSKDMELKAGALLKLTYLDMLGYDMSWASFHVVEVMSSPKFHLKTVGYLAAVQSFDQDTDVLMLTTNLLKKDLTSLPTDAAVTLNGLSHIVTPDLARDLAPEIIAMLNHSRAHIRKRAVLAVYKILVKYPDAPQQARVRLEEKLQDPDPGVIAATVNVLCELARHSPTDYLALAPQLFHLLTTSSNNWMLIKIVKLFGSLSPHEPRLVKKLQPPITELISTTPAISLLYECVHTCIIGGMLQGSSGDSLARLCVSKLATFIQDPDQNLKYIALLALAKIVPSHPHLVAEYQDTILASVNDQDISIRMRALDLVSAMVDSENLQSIVQHLLGHLVTDASAPSPSAAQSLSQTGPSTSRPTVSPSQSPAYRLVLAQRILSFCSRETYTNVTNFEWYTSVLVDLSHVAKVDIGQDICDQLVDVAGRVRAARPYAIKLMYNLLSDDAGLSDSGEDGTCSEVFWAAAWICGEYCSELSEPQRLIPHLLRNDILSLKPDIMAVFIQSATKIFGHWASLLAERWDDDRLPEVTGMVDTIVDTLVVLSGSSDIEVQERAANSLQLFKLIRSDLSNYKPRAFTSGFSSPGPSSAFDPIPPLEPHFPKSLYLIQPLFGAYELNPVATKAQEYVPVPEGLDLDAWIVPPPREKTVDVEVTPGEKKGKKGKKGKGKEINGHKSVKSTSSPLEALDLAANQEDVQEAAAEREKRKAERREMLRDDPYYIIDDPPLIPTQKELDAIPVVRLEGLPSLTPEPDFGQLASLRPLLRPSPSIPFVVEKIGEMPENSTLHSNVPDSRSSTPLSAQLLPTSRPASSMRADDEARPNTPPPIVVKRSKKREANSKKKPWGP